MREIKAEISSGEGKKVLDQSIEYTVDPRRSEVAVSCGLAVYCGIVKLFRE